MSQQQTFSGGSSPSTPNIEFIEGNTGGPVGPNPATFTINIDGDTNQGVHVNGNSVTYTETITVDNSTTTQKGVLLLADNAETIAGTNTTKAITPDDLKAKLGLQTLHGIPYGNSTTGTIQWLTEASNGQLPIGSSGGIPVLANMTSLDKSVTITNGPGSIDLSATSAKGTANTVGVNTSDILSFDLGGVAGTFQFEARVKGFESTGPAGCGYNIYSTFTTDGSSATLLGNQSTFNEDPTLVTADAYFIASGNNAVLQVLGVALLTINWVGEISVT